MKRKEKTQHDHFFSAVSMFQFYQQKDVVVAVAVEINRCLRSHARNNFTKRDVKNKNVHLL
jgi:hypothetical protein